MKKYTVFTDGSSYDQLNIGGWGCLVYPDFDFKRYNKLEFNGRTTGDVTSNTMELIAVINAIKHLPKNSSITIFTDSRYIIFGATYGIHIWPKNNWISRRGFNIHHKSLWIDFHNLIKKYEHIDVKWVKGHHEDPDNWRADTLARLGTKNKIMCPRLQAKSFDVFLHCKKIENKSFEWSFQIKGQNFLSTLAGVENDIEFLKMYKIIASKVVDKLEFENYEFANIYSSTRSFGKVFNKNILKCNFMHINDQKIHPNTSNHYKQLFFENSQ